MQRVSSSQVMLLMTGDLSHHMSGSVPGRRSGATSDQTGSRAAGK